MHSEELHGEVWMYVCFGDFVSLCTCYLFVLPATCSRVCVSICLCICKCLLNIFHNDYDGNE